MGAITRYSNGSDIADVFFHRTQTKGPLPLHSTVELHQAPQLIDVSLAKDSLRWSKKQGRMVGMGGSDRQHREKFPYKSLAIVKQQ
jgi:hypothetical protein